MKLGLGTVQFGLDYGISNANGQVAPDTIRELLGLAASSKVDLLDTAAGYGNSEETLGDCLPRTHAFHIVSKTAAFNKPVIETTDATQLREDALRSLQRLKQERLYGLMMHRPEDLLGPGGDYLFDAMQALKAEGLIEKTGISVYSSEQIERIMDRFPIDMIQLPINILDQRLLANNLLATIKAAGVEVHARSIFLQGLLLMQPEQLPAWFSPGLPTFRRYREALNRQGLSPVQGAAAFIRGIPEIDRTIFGVTHTDQLREIVAAFETPIDFDFSAFALNDPALVDPSQWPARQGVRQ